MTAKTRPGQEMLQGFSDNPVNPLVVKRVGLSFASARYLLQDDGFLSNEHLALVLEGNPNSILPPWLHQYFIRHLRGEVKRKRGRKPRNPAALDFALGDAIVLYEERLKHHQKLDRLGKAPAKADRVPPQERALREVLTEMQNVFPNITWEGLRNLLSKHNNRPDPMA